jgi:hypothetical protein
MVKRLLKDENARTPLAIERLTKAWHHPVVVSGAPVGPSNHNADAQKSR